MKTEKMFYVVSKALGQAMISGHAKQPKGTVYGIYATHERAVEAMKAKRIFIQDGRNGPTRPAGHYAMIVEQ